MTLTTTKRRIKPSDKISLPFPTKDRQKFLANRLVQIYGDGYLDESKASYKMQYGKVAIKNAEGTKILQQYAFAFEIIAIPYSEEMIMSDPAGLHSEFIGLVNSSYSAKGTKFDGSYRWTKQNSVGAYARDIIGVLQEYGFVFYDYRRSKDKVPCIIAGNLISDRIDYTEKSKAEFDISPFVDTIRVAVSKVSRGIKSFAYFGIVFERDQRESRVEKPRRPKRRTIKSVVKEILMPRIEKVKAGGKITTEQTQDEVWYLALPLFDKYGVVYQQKSRPGFKTEIRKLCKKYGVSREEIGIIASPWASMFFMGEWYEVSYYTIQKLAEKGTDQIFIEKRGVVKKLGKYSSEVGVALVNTHGQLSDYSKELADLAETSGANIAIFTDYDIYGIQIASKLEGVMWLGVDERMLDHFDILHENVGDRKLVVTSRPKRSLLRQTKNAILSDERFDSVVDAEFLE